MNSTRQFLKTSLVSGMETGIVGPADVLRHATPEVLASNLPPDKTAKLLQASLAAAAMDPQLVVETLGIETLAEHLPTNVLWACLAEMAGKALGGATASAVAAAPAPEPTVEDKPAAKPQAKVKPRPAPPPAPASKKGRRSDRRPARLKPRSATGSDFDVDTDVGEQWPTGSGNGEAEALGAAPAPDDWQKSEETATKNVVDPGPRSKSKR